MRIDVHQPTNTEAAMLMNPQNLSVPDLNELEKLLTLNFLDVFGNEDWDLMAHLPTSTYWHASEEYLVSDVCELEYQVVHIADLLDADEGPLFIADPDERAALEAWHSRSPILCEPFDLRIPLGLLLEKLSYMSDDHERSLHQLLEWSYSCMVIHAAGQAVSPRFRQVLSILESNPIWSAYLRASPKNPPARFAHHLRHRLIARAQSPSKNRRHAHAPASCARRKSPPAGR